MAIKVGDRVKLRDYEPHSDWREHRGQEGIVTHLRVRGSMYSIRIRWADGLTSTSPEKNIIQVATPKEELNMKKIEQTAIEQGDTQRIILPKGMSYAEARECLTLEEQQMNKEVGIKDEIKAFVCDAAVAFVRALKELYGFVDERPTPGFFGDTPPQQFGIEVEHGRVIFVPIGVFGLPGIHGTVTTNIQKNSCGKMVMTMNALVKKRNEAQIRALFNLAKKYAAEESIYKGKAFKLKLTDQDGRQLPFPTPEFLDLRKVNESQLVFSDEVNTAIETSLFTPIENTTACRENKIPLKRGVLLAGKYGVGKTLTTYVTAKKCVDNGWTFIYAESADELAEIVKLAHFYQPAVVFCEDIDRVVNGERSLDMDAILNIIDGIESKGTELMVVLTTNHVEQINRALLRPGRLDAVINVTPPDAKAVEKLLRLYGGKLIPQGEELGIVAESLAGRIPAIIREVIERAKLSAIHEQLPGESLTLSVSALEAASASMKNQLDLLDSTAEKKSSRLDDALKVVGQSLQIEVRED